MNLVIYTNILTPYRKYFYDFLYKYFEEKGYIFHVLVMAETEGNRTWQYEDFKEPYTILLKGKSISKGEIYIHVNNNIIDELRKIKPDVVVCAGSYLCPGVWIVSRLKRRLNYKCLYWSESHLNEKRNYSQLKLLIRSKIRSFFYKRFDGFWYAGTLSKEFILKYSKKGVKYFFVPNLVDENRYLKASSVNTNRRNELRAEYHLNESQIVFICPARLSPVKGIVEFIDLFCQCKHKKRGTILVAGTGELKDKIESKSKETGVDIRLLGYKSQDEMIKLYSMADVFLLPSLSDPNPLTCIEALWAGLPLFISNHCGNYPEVIDFGENGYVFDYEDKKTVIDLIDNVLDSSIEWIEHARVVSLEKAKRQYCISKVVEDLIEKMEDWEEA